MKFSKLIDLITVKQQNRGKIVLYLYSFAFNFLNTYPYDENTILVKILFTKGFYIIHNKRLCVERYIDIKPLKLNNHEESPDCL